jgi:hypothetical protein
LGTGQDGSERFQRDRLGIIATFSAYIPCSAVGDTCIENSRTISEKQRSGVDVWFRPGVAQPIITTKGRSGGPFFYGESPCSMML